MIGTKEGVYRCRTVKRRAEELSYDPNCTDYLNIKYDEYILKGAKTRQHVSMPRNIESQEIPTRGREFVPRRLYMMPKDYEDTDSPRAAEDARGRRIRSEPAHRTASSVDSAWRVRSARMRTISE